jgi:hypothetical protein
MEQQVARARELLPAIIITVLSMIQALALELFWSRVRESDYLWSGGLDALVGWLQLTVLLLGILQIWLFYVSLMLRFSWVPAMQDTLVPFAIGLLEFSMIDMVGPDSLGPWTIALALVFALCVFATHTAHRRARRDPANDYFFRNVAPTSWRDYRHSIGVVSTLLVLGVVLWITGARTWLPLVALCFGLAALIYQLVLTQRYWMHTLVSRE